MRKSATWVARPVGSSGSCGSRVNLIRGMRESLVLCSRYHRNRCSGLSTLPRSPLVVPAIRWIVRLPARQTHSKAGRNGAAVFEGTCCNANRELGDAPAHHIGRDSSPLIGATSSMEPQTVVVQRPLALQPSPRSATRRLRRWLSRSAIRSKMSSTSPRLPQGSSDVARHRGGLCMSRRWHADATARGLVNLVGPRDAPAWRLARATGPSCES